MLRERVAGAEGMRYFTLADWEATQKRWAWGNSWADDTYRILSDEREKE